MIGNYSKDATHEDICKTDAIIMRQQFSAALRDAKAAAKDLYNSYGTPGLEYIDNYGKSIISQLRKVRLPKDFTPSEYKERINLISSIMRRASEKFNWNDPNLDLISEPDDWSKPDKVYAKSGSFTKESKSSKSAPRLAVTAI